MKSRHLLFFLLVVVLLLAGSALAVWHAAENMNLGLDLRGGVYVLYRAVDKAGEDSSDKIDRAVLVIRNRIDALGIAEPVVQPEGSDRIRVELPGIKDQRAAREVIGKTALLRFVGPDGETIVEGDDLKNAQAIYDQYNQPAVSLEFNAEGTEKFAEATKKFFGQPIAIYLDEEEISAPIVNAVIEDGKAIINNISSIDRAATLALQLRSGALPVQLEELEIRGVGPLLGQDSLNRSIRAGIAGLLLVILFMLVYYRGFGFVADVALFAYAAIVMLVLIALNVTLTLPGIAGIILSIGMAVDANIVIFERIKEEMRQGKTVRTAIEAGFSRAFRAILDSNITTLIAAAVLFRFAQGPVRGFAVTLSIGILASMFTAVVLTRYLLRLAAGAGLVKTVQQEVRQREKSFDFIAARKYAVAFTVCLLLVGVASLAVQGLNYSIDFTGGTIMQIDMRKPFSLEEVREVPGLSGATLQKVGVEEGVGEGTVNELLIKTVELSPAEQEELFSALQEKFSLPDEALLQANSVGAVIGGELQRQALIALLIASLCMGIYIAIRFEHRFAVTAVLALLHDAFFMVTVFSLFRLEVSMHFIAAVLTIIGYSINDTIIIYDRIRENLRLSRKADYAEVVQNSITQSLSRTILTSLTTALVLVTLLAFGGATLRPFIIALQVGVICGTFSSIFLAPPLWHWWKERGRKKLKPQNA